MSNTKTNQDAVLSGEPGRLDGQIIAGSDAVREEIRETLATNKALEVLGVFITAQDEVSGSNTTLSLTRGEIRVRSGNTIPSTSLDRCMALFLEVGIIEARGKEPGRRGQTYWLTDEASRLGFGEWGRQARAALGTALQSAEVSESPLGDKYQDLPSRELREMFAKTSALEVLGIFFQEYDRVHRDRDRVNLSRIELLKLSADTLSETTVGRRLEDFVSCGVLTRHQSPCDKRLVFYTMTDSCIGLAQGEVGNLAKTALEKVLRRAKGLYADFHDGGELEQVFEPVELDDNRLSIVGALADPTLLGFSRGSRVSLKDLVSAACGEDLRNRARDEVSYLQELGLVRKAGAREYELTAAGRAVYREKRDQIAPILMMRAEARAKGQDPVLKLRQAVERRVEADEALQRTFDYLFDDPSNRIPVFFDVMRSSQRSPSRVALVNHVQVGWFTRTGEKTTTKATKRYFEELRERDVLDASNRPTELSQKVNGVLLELRELIPGHWKVVLDEAREQRPEAVLGAQFGHVHVDAAAIHPDEAGLEPACSMPALPDRVSIAVGQETPVDTVPTSDTENLEHEVAPATQEVAAPGADTQVVLEERKKVDQLVRQTRDLAAQYETYALALESAELREGDRLTLEQKSPTEGLKLLPTAKVLAAIEAAAVSVSPNAEVQLELKGEVIVAHVSRPDPTVGGIIRFASRRSQFLPSQWSVESLGADSSVSEIERDVSHLLRELQGESASFLKHYSGIKGEIVNLGELLSIVLSNPLLTADVRQVEVNAAISGVHESALAAFYGPNRVHGYPSCHDGNSNNSLAKINRLSTALRSSSPEAIGIALTAIRLGESHDRVRDFARTLMHCRELLHIANVPLSQVSSALVPTSLPQHVRLEERPGRAISGQFEYRSLDGSDCSLIVRQLSTPPYCKIERICISPETDLTQLASLVKQFELAREVLTRRIVSWTESNNHKHVRALNDSSYAQHFTPPNLAGGMVVVTDGKLGRSNTVYAANFSALFSQRGLGSMVELAEFSCDRKARHEMQSEIEACFRYNVSLLDRLLHGPDTQRMLFASGPQEGNLPEIRVAEQSRSSAAIAEWLQLLAEKVDSGTLNSAFLALLGSASPSKQSERALLGAEVLSRVLNQSEQLEVAHGVTLIAVESGSDGLTFHFSAPVDQAARELLSSEETGRPEGESEGFYRARKPVADSSVAGLAEILGKSQSLGDFTRLYLAELRDLERSLDEERCDSSTFHRHKARLLRERFRRGEDLKEIVGPLSGLLSYEVSAALQASRVSTERGQPVDAETFAYALRLLSQVGFWKTELVTGPTERLTVKDPNVSELVEPGSPLNPKLEEHIITDCELGDCSFALSLLWSRGQFALSPKIRKVWVGPNFNRDRFEFALIGIHRAILDEFRGADLRTLGRMVESRIDKPTSFSVRDSYDRRFLRKEKLTRALWVTDGVPYCELSAEGEQVVKLQRFSYGVRIAPTTQSDLVRVDGLACSNNERSGNSVSPGVLGAMRDVVLQVLQHNVDVLSR
jgi:hypothetical protein